MDFEKLASQLIARGYAINTEHIREYQSRCAAAFNTPVVRNLPPDISAYVKSFFLYSGFGWVPQFFLALQTNAEDFVGVDAELSKLINRHIKLSIIAILSDANAMHSLRALRKSNPIDHLYLLLQASVEYFTDLPEVAKTSLALELVAFPEMYNKFVTAPLNSSVHSDYTSTSGAPAMISAHIDSLCWGGSRVLFKGELDMPLELALSHNVAGLEKIVASYIKRRNKPTYINLRDILGMIPPCAKEHLGLYIMLTTETILPSAHISEKLLNGVVAAGQFKGLSVARMLANTEDGLQILTANDYALARLISADTLNAITNDGDSFASILAADPVGLQILAANDYALARLISAGSLNTLEHGGMQVGESSAFKLACTPEGCQILAANDYALARLISADSLNALLDNNFGAGESVVFRLAADPVGLQILAANDYALARLISADTLNAITTYDDALYEHPFGAGVTGESVAFRLAADPVGRQILAANDYALARLISADTLNAVIDDDDDDPNAGKTCMTVLQECPDGRALLEVINQKLAVEPKAKRIKLW